MSFTQYRDTYSRFWSRMHIRPERIGTIDGVLNRGLRGKPRYLDLQEQTGIPWWFFMFTHYRESNFNFGTYLGNGEPLGRVTRLVPRGRGPWSGPNAFEDGAIDAMKIEGFLNCIDWSMERVCYRFEGYNGFGYHHKHCRLGEVASPYLYGGSTAYGPPEACAGKYVSDGVYSSTHVDSQLGTVTLLKQLCLRDDTVGFTHPEAKQLAAVEPDDVLSDGVAWIQRTINARGLSVGSRRLVEDGRLGRNTMHAIANFQIEHDIEDTGLPDSNTLTQLLDASRPAKPNLLSAMPALGAEAGALMGELYDQ